MKEGHKVKVLLFFSSSFRNEVSVQFKPKLILLTYLLSIKVNIKERLGKSTKVSYFCVLSLTVNMNIQ